MVIKKIIPTFLFLSLCMQSVLAGPKDRILPWLIGTIATSVGSVGYVVGRSAQEAAPQLTQQAVEQIANKAATQATAQAAKQGPSLIAQAASSTWEAVKVIAPSLLSKQGAGIAAGVAASAGAWYGWRNRAAIAKNGKKILENTRLIQDLRAYVEQQFTNIRTKIDEFRSESRQRDDASKQRQQEILRRLSALENEVRTNGNGIQRLTEISQENNSLLRQIADQMHHGQNRILTAMGVPENRTLWQHMTSLLSRN